MILGLIVSVSLYFLKIIDRARFAQRVVEFPSRGLVLKASILGPRGAKEADIIRFVQRHTSIPTPHVVLSGDIGSRHYFLMKEVRGTNLGRVWGTMTPTQRQHVVEQLRDFVTQLRALKSPHDRAVCSLDGAALQDSRITNVDAVGPFRNEGAFNDRLLATTAAFGHEDLVGLRSRMRDDHAIMFTHGDIAPRNIMVDDDGNILALLDWEQAGWYPEHWESIKALWFLPGPWHPCGELWIEAVKEIFEGKYEEEWKVERELSEYIVGPI